MAKTIGAGFWSELIGAIRTRLRFMIFGNPLATSVQLEHRLPILLALPVFASDALSSVAYATEEILLQFENDGHTALALAFILGITAAIVVLMVIVGASYYQAIHLYPSGGGSYAVSRDNLGVWPGMVAAAALTIDYILTVAVSVSSGVEQLASAVPFITEHRLNVLMALLLVAIITIINLRGTKESGWAFALPAYSFIVMLSVALIIMVIRWVTGHTQTFPTPEHLIISSPITGFALWFLVLKAFASGCSALTGVEAVSNGVSAFEPPEAKNAAKTLVILIGILVVLFSGVGVAAWHYHVLPIKGETVISQIARASFIGVHTPLGQAGLLGLIPYYLTVGITLAVLMIAANTSFAGLPRLLALVAKDGYAPKAFVTLGDRLVHNRGILMLTVISALLIVAFNARTNRLIPLYAVGVFICFTLSQLGMVKRVRIIKAKGWQRAMVVNLLGALVTGVVAIIQAVTKFFDGAWAVVVLMPAIVSITYVIHRHYQWFDKTMTLHEHDYNPLAEPPEPLTVLVLVSSDVHRGILEGLECGRAIVRNHPDNVLRAVHIEMDPEKTPRLKARWAQFVEPYLGEQIKLDIIPSPYRWLIEPIQDYLDWTDLERSGDRVIVVLPEFETGNWITHLLHNYTARRLRTALLNRPHVTVVSSRYFMRPMAWRLGRGGLVY